MKKAKKITIITIVIIAISILMFFIGRQVGLNTDISSTTTTIEEQTVGKQTIKKTLTGSGEIQTSNTEKLSISTTKYFETMCVEEDDMVKEGENILKYTDGTYLVAPYDCIISTNSAPESGAIATSSNYIEVKDLKNLTTTLSINENEISNLTLDKNVDIVLTADTSKTYTGTITKIDSVGTYSTSGTTFSIEISFENDGNAKLGMSVSSTINIEELTDVLAVPIDAVQTEGDKKYVIVVENKETKEVEIETGLSNDEYVQVMSGLNGGETIQVVTTTKQNTTRGTKNSGSSNSDSGERDFQGGGNSPMMQQDGSQMQGMPDMGGQQLKQ